MGFVYGFVGTVKELQLANNDLLYAILRQRDLGVSTVGQSLPAIDPQKGSCHPTATTCFRALFFSVSP